MGDVYMHALANLPTRLNTYDTTAFKENVGDDERCLYCWRYFNSNTEDDNPEETPCKPLRLNPCGHIIGNQCFQRLIQHSVRDCQLCRNPVGVLSCENLPSWLVFLAENRVYKHINTACEREILPTRLAHALNQYYQDLLDGTIGIKQGLLLWLVNMSGLLMAAFPSLVFAFWLKGLWQVTKRPLRDLSVLATNPWEFGSHILWTSVGHAREMREILCSPEFAVVFFFRLAEWKWGPEDFTDEILRQMNMFDVTIGPLIWGTILWKKESSLGSLVLGLSLLYAAITTLLIWYGNGAARTRATARP